MPILFNLEYRVAAIFPEHFQSFTIALKSHIFHCFFCAKLSQLVVQSLIKTNRHIPAKMNQLEAIRAGTVSRLRAGRTVKVIISYGGFSKKTFFAMINESLNITKTTLGRWCWGWIRYLKISITSSSREGNPAHNSKRTQDWLKKNLMGGVGEGDSGSQLPWL